MVMSYRLELLSYQEWCKQEKLPRDAISKEIYTQFVKDVPSLQAIIDCLLNGYIYQAHEKLSLYIEKQEKMMNRK